MDDCFWLEMEEAKDRGEDLTPYLERLRRCRWDHDVTSCEVCREDGVLSAQTCMVKVYNLGVRS